MIMNLKGVAKGLDQGFYYILLGIFLSTTFMYLFLFVLNWEYWFFGTKMDGLNAGIILFTYFLISASLAYLLFRYPRRIVIIALLSIFFFGFIFIDSATTIQKMSSGLRLYSDFLAMLVLAPAVILAGHLIVARFYDMEEDSEGGWQENELILKIFGKDESGDYTIKQVLILAIAAFVIVLLFRTLVLIPALILISVLLAVRIVKKDDDPEKGGQENGLGVAVIRLLMGMTILIALLLLVCLVIPVFSLLIIR